jgi:hypothetical protein
MNSNWYTPAQITMILSETSFDAFYNSLEGQPHNLVHTGICGDMCDPNTSPNDPIFWL